MIEKKKNSAWFAIGFIAALLAVSALVFLTFTYYQRTMAEARRLESAKNLKMIRAALLNYAKTSGHFPVSPSELSGIFKGNAEFLIHPSWPEQAGYVYISGSDPKDFAPEIMMVFENVPDRKRKLGRQSVNVDGNVKYWTDEDFERALAYHEKTWKIAPKPWRLIEIRAE